MMRVVGRGRPWRAMHLTRSSAWRRCGRSGDETRGSPRAWHSVSSVETSRPCGLSPTSGAPSATNDAPAPGLFSRPVRCARPTFSPSDRIGRNPLHCVPVAPSLLARQELLVCHNAYAADNRLFPRCSSAAVRMATRQANWGTASSSAGSDMSFAGGPSMSADMDVTRDLTSSGTFVQRRLQFQSDPHADPRR